MDENWMDEAYCETCSDFYESTALIECSQCGRLTCEGCLDSDNICGNCCCEMEEE